MRVLLVDAYDSFVYIVKNYIDVLGHQTTIVRSDHLDHNSLLSYNAVVLGPGPGHPNEWGYDAIIQAVEGKVPLFGICLGMQAIAAFYGMRIVQASRRLHGKRSIISHDGKACFRHLPEKFKVTRYHSLIVEDSISGESSPLEISARSLDDNYIMALRHSLRMIEGVQFHPESIYSEHGAQILENFFLQVQ